MCVFLAFAQTGTGQRWKLATVLSSGRHSEPPTEYISRPGVCGAEGKFLNNVENMVMSPSAAPPSYHVPLAYLPRLATTTGLLCLSFGSAALVALLGLDAWKSFRRKTHWIPGDSLILGALSLQLLSLLNRPIVTISDDQKLTESSVIELSDVIHENQLLILGGRVVMCVFIGNLLPGVARPRCRNLWSDMVALLISVFVAVVHVSYEVYIVVIRNRVLQHASASNRPWDLRTISLLASNIIVFVAIIWLVLLLGCAALAGKSIQDILAQRIPVALSHKSRSESGETSWTALQSQLVKSWIMVRTSDPQYLIARSALSASTAFLVTICVAAFVVEWSVHAYKRQKDAFDGCRVVALALQCVFMSIGCAIVWWRWLTALVYYPRRFKIRPSHLRTYFHTEDFWTRSLVELEQDIKSEGSYLKRFVACFIKGLRLHKLLPVLVGLQILLVLLSKFCWLISEVLFSRECIRRLLMGSHGYREFAGLLQPQVSDTESSSFRAKYLPALIHLPHENPAGVWVAHRKSIENMRSGMEEAELKGKGFEPLISLLRGKTSPGFAGARSLGRSSDSAPKLPVESYFNVGRHCAKMTAVSLIAIMIELSTFYEEYESPCLEIGGPRLVKDAVRACSQAWEMMGLLQHSEPGAVHVNKAADAALHSLQESNKWLGIQLPVTKIPGGDLCSYNSIAAREAVLLLGEKGKQMSGHNGEEAHDSQDWKVVMAGVGLYRVCSAVDHTSADHVAEFLEEVRCLLADVLGSCLANMANCLGGECRKWTEDFAEEKVWKAIKVVSILKGVMEAAGWEFGCEDGLLRHKTTAGEEGNEAVNRSMLRKFATFPRD